MSARVLVIEDNPAGIELIAYLLKAFAYTPLKATSGEAGLEVARREKPDLILCDVQLPGMDGHAVCRALKSDPELRSIPLLAVTAYAMVGDREQLLGEGFDGYISKPINPEIFIAQLKPFLGTQQMPPSRPAAPAAAGSAQAASRSAPASGMTVMVVDNTAENLELNRSILEARGYRVILVTSVREALEAARKSPPDLIISDVHMPVEGGFDLIKAVKADRELASIPFVFLSSTSMGEGDRRTGLSLGAVKFIVRPIEPEVLLDEIGPCLK